MFETSFSILTGSRLNEDSIDANTAFSFDNDDDMFGHLPKHVVRNALPTKQPVISGLSNQLTNPMARYWNLEIRRRPRLFPILFQLKV